MIALLPVHRLMRIAGLGKGGGRKLLIGAFDFLQHQHIRLILAQKIEDEG